MTRMHPFTISRCDCAIAGTLQPHLPFMQDEEAIDVYPGFYPI